MSAGELLSEIGLRNVEVKHKCISKKCWPQFNRNLELTKLKFDFKTYKLDHTMQQYHYQTKKIIQE